MAFANSGRGLHVACARACVRAFVCVRACVRACERASSRAYVFRPCRLHWGGQVATSGPIPSHNRFTLTLPRLAHPRCLTLLCPQAVRGRVHRAGGQLSTEQLQARRQRWRPAASRGARWRRDEQRHDEHSARGWGKPHNGASHGALWPLPAWWSVEAGHKLPLAPLLRDPRPWPLSPPAPASTSGSRADALLSQGSVTSPTDAISHSPCFCGRRRP